MLKKIKSLTWMDFVALMATPLMRDSRDDPFHKTYRDFISQVNARENAHILEIGSRRTILRDHFTNYSTYTGLDIHPGEGVDVVGDIYQLASYFPNKRFDAVFAISTFEHLAMPWKASLEIAKVMNVGGLLFISTHPTWAPHELPWDFYRFSAESFKPLLGGVGFEIIHAVEGLPCRILPLNTERSTRRVYNQTANMGVSVLARKVREPDSRLCWDVDVSDVLETSYPQHSRSYGDDVPES